ncbi:hypothetical protein F5Y07DRAFT_410194 [Xylaria sp. FL0933]|nr:hypothetical protein F5Y07DRAFT_410194 [Xylaria sp. FL0933]
MSSNSASLDAGRGPMIMAVLWSLTVAASFTVMARFYVRKQLKALYWDDWLMLAAVIFQLVDTGFITGAYSFGLGKHDADLTFDQLVNALKWGWLGMIPGTFVAALARVSGAIFLIRLFGFSCLSALWNPTIKASKMDPNIALYAAYTAQALFTFADLTYVLFPVIIIWRLNMSFHRKLALILLICTSLLTAAASITKAWSTPTVSADLTEPQYASSFGALWSDVEQTLVIILGSVPTLCAAAQVNFPIFSRAGVFITSRLSSTSYKKALVSRDRYADSEFSAEHQVDTHGLGRLHPNESEKGFGSLAEATVTHADDSNWEVQGESGLGYAARGVDQFAISYSPKP